MRKKMSWEEAVAACTDVIDFNLDTDTIPLGLGLNRVAAEDLLADNDVPLFDRSQVDGYAVTAEDYGCLKSETGTEIAYEVIGTIAAGIPLDLELVHGKTAKIMTGGCLPRGTAAVIKQEYVVSAGHSLVNITTNRNEKNWCERRGSLVKKGQIIAKAGEVLKENTLELLASAGVSSIKVYRKPKVYIISTGTELIMPGSTAERGQIYNSNFTMLAAELQKEDCELIQGIGNLQDDLTQISAEIQKGMDCSDLVIITGGASEGEYDLVPAAMRKAGCSIICGQLDMKPGTRVTLAVKDKKVLLNLPGNPAAGSILFGILIVPILRKLKGISDFYPRWFSIRLLEAIPHHGHCRWFCRGQLVETANGLQAIPLERYDGITGIASLVLDIAPEKGQKGDLVRGLII